MVKGRPHDYEKEYDEYDGYLNVDALPSKQLLKLNIISKFGLNDNSASLLADTLWEIKVVKQGREIAERELTKPEPELRPIPRPTRISTWRTRSKAKTSAYRRRIESYLRRHPDATIKEARGHA